MPNIKIYKNNFYQLFKNNKNKDKIFLVILNNGIVFSTTSNYLYLTEYLVETDICLVSEKSPFKGVIQPSKCFNKEEDIYRIPLKDISYIVECKNYDLMFTLQHGLCKNFDLSFIKSEEELSSLSEVWFIHNDKFMLIEDKNRYRLMHYSFEPLTTFPTRIEINKLKASINYLIDMLKRCQVFKTIEEGDEYLRYLEFLDKVDLDEYLEEYISRTEKEFNDYLEREYRREVMEIAEIKRKGGNKNN